MLRSYLLVAWRNILRNKLFSLINIVGLAIGMSSVFLIYLYNVVEHSYDRQAPSAENIYRITSGYYSNDEAIIINAENSPAMGPAMKDAFPEIEEYTRLFSLTHTTTTITISGMFAGKPVGSVEDHVYYAEPNTITMFGMQMIEGDAATSLASPYSVVLTESVAKKFYGDQSAVGQLLRVNTDECKVTGVIRDLPPNTHLNIDVLLSFPEKNWLAQDWHWINFLTYVKVQPRTDVQQLKSKLNAFADPHYGRSDRYAFDLQPIRNIHLNSHLATEMKDNGDARAVYFIALLGVIILLIAWINYINLSTAKAIERAKEVGLRKVAGAGRWQLVGQFLLDALLINIGAAMAAVVITTAMLPSFEALTGVPVSLILKQSHIIDQPDFWMLPVLVLVTGVLIVGCYPAIVLSSFKPAVVLKGKFTKSGSGVFLRKLLVSFQYVLSIMLIGGTIAISSQINFMQSQDLGYDLEQMLIVTGPNNVDSTLRSRVSAFTNDQFQLPEIIQMGKSGNVPGSVMTFSNSIRLFGHDESDNVSSFNTGIDDRFFDTYGIQLVAGRQLTENDRFSFPNNPPVATVMPPPDRRWHPERNKIMINEKLSQRLGFKTPGDAIHQKVTFRAWDEFTGEIIGVVKNYHQQSLKTNYEPIFYFYPDFDQWSKISIRVQGDDLPGTIEKIHRNYSNAFPGNPFEYSFLDETFNRQYKGDQQLRDVISTLTGLAMVIACLGLVGLGVYSVNLRFKEVGIRKVLGAPVNSILVLFCGDSAKIVGWSTVIALPLLVWGVRTWLSNFAFHIGLEWGVLVIPPVVLLLVSVITIVSISLRAAMMNPAKTLRSE